MFRRAIDQALADELAADAPSRDRVLELISQGADVNAVDGLGESLLMHAVSIVSMSKTDSLQFIELLIKKGANLTHRIPKENTTALHLAIFAYKPELIRLLLERGADPDIIGDGESVLDAAEFDLWFEEGEAGTLGDNHRECIEALKEMIVLLKAHGAKTTAEIRLESTSEAP